MQARGQPQAAVGRGESSFGHLAQDGHPDRQGVRRRDRGTAPVAVQLNLAMGKADKINVEHISRSDLLQERDAQ